MNNEENISIDSINEQSSLDEALANQRKGWYDEIAKLNEKMKSIQKVDELLNEVYNTRQNAVKYYYDMNAVILKQTKLYKAQYNQMFNNIKINGYNGMRLGTDQAIARQIETDLQETKAVIDLLNNQNNFIKETISTIDNIIYGINQKVKIYELINGMKF